MLVESAALAEAERLVDACIDSPEGMIGESEVPNPDGPEVFESLDEARFSKVGRSTVVDVSELACAPSDLSTMRNLQNI